jgi:micrococcal nuclease
MMAFRSLALPGVAAALLLNSGAPENGFDGAQLAATTFDGPVSAHVERVVDGDTIEVKADIWLEQSVTVRVRIEGVDAPEMEARCSAERERAEAARDFLIRRIGGSEVQLSQVVYDKYGGRVRASVSDSSGDIAEALLRKGLARPYHGGKRMPWCEPA